MKEKKLIIGDKIKWVSSLTGIVFTILDIDTSESRGNNQVLFQWERDGLIYQDWFYTIASLNHTFNRGRIIIVERDILPRKELLKFSMI